MSAGNRDWRNQGKPAPTGSTSPQTGQGAGKRGWQAQQGPAKGPKKPWSRRSKLGFAAGILGSLVAVLVLLVWLLRPIKPACIVLIGASYDENLTLPHNLYGWKSLKDLEELAKSSDGILRTSTTGHPNSYYALKEWKNVSWDKELANFGANIDEEAVMIFLTLHGSTDAKGAYFLLDDDRAQKRLYLDQVIKDIGKAPGLQKKKVVLVLEPVLHDAIWATGTLHNDFVAKLKDQEKAIKSQGNLVVFCASDVDQKSWPSEEWRRTIFMHYIFEGLQGAADAAGNNNQHVTIDELFRYVKDRVQAWSISVPNVEQTPIMLGDDSIRDTELAHVKAGYVEKTPETAPGNNFTVSADLQQAWKNAEITRANNPHPAVYSPQVWRFYQDTLLRYEQMIRAGDPTKKAASLLSKLNGLDETLRKQGTFDQGRAVVNNALPLATSFSLATSLTDDEKTRFQSLWDGIWIAKDEMRAEALAKFDEWVTKETKLDARLIRGLLYRQLLTQLSAGAATTLNDLLDPTAPPGDAKAGKVARLLGLPRPAEAHFLVMLVQDLDRQMPASGLAELKLALEVRILAETAALGVTPGSLEHPYSEEVFAWVQDAIGQADVLRRQGEDRLFAASPESWKVAGENLKEAKAKSQTALADAVVVREALRTRDRALADLPYLAQWVANQRHTDVKQLPNVKVAGWEKQIRSVGEQAKRLSAVFQDEARNLAGLDALTNSLRKEHDDLQRSYGKEQGELSKLKLLQKQWHDAAALLSVPLLSMPVLDGVAGDPVKARLDLLTNLRKMSMQFNGGEMKKKGDAAELDQAILKEAQQRQKTLALAVLEPFRTKVLVEAKAGELIAETWLDLPERYNSGLKKSLANPDLALALPELREADLVSRGMPGGYHGLLTGDLLPAPVALRRLRLHNLLLHQAKRTLADHWFVAPDSNDRTYYGPTATAYLKLAQTLVEEGADDKELRDKRVATSQVMLDSIREVGMTLTTPESPDGTVAWTSERELVLQAEMALDKTDKHLQPPGVPVVWYDITRPNPADNFSKPRQVWPDFSERIRPKLSERAKATVQFTSLYRGQRLHANVNVAMQPPDTIAYHFPPPDMAAVAVRPDPNFTYGSVCIVLDCSSSMLEGKKGDTRFDKAVAALGIALEAIPENTHVSLLAFITKTGQANHEFIMERAPAPWQSGQARNLIQGIKQLGKQIDPNYSLTPLALAMREARENGLPRNVGGPRLIVALTDGSDNKSVTVNINKKAQPDVYQKEYTRKLQNFLKDEFGSPRGIELHVVCFNESLSEEDKADKANAEAQFQIVEDRTIFDPPGTFVIQPDYKKLADDLTRVIIPKVKISTVPIAEWQAGKPGGNLHWQTVKPGEYSLTLRRETPSQSVKLNAGDRMLVTIKRSGKDIRWERGLFEELPNAKLVSTKANQRQVSLFENRADPQRNVLHQLFAIEDLVQRDVLQQNPPRFVWIETKSFAGRKTDVVEWYQDYLYLGPSYRFRVGNWSFTDTAASKVWWTDQPEDDQFSKLVELSTKSTGSKKIEIRGNKFVFESSVIENQTVSLEYGKQTEKSCLVVRMNHPPGKSVKLQLHDKHVGEEHRYYDSANKYTAIFWFAGNPPDQPAFNMNLVSLFDFKKEVEASSHAAFQETSKSEVPRRE